MAMTANHHAFSSAVQVHEPSLAKQNSAQTQGVLGGSPALAGFMGCPVSISVKDEVTNNHMHEAYAMLANVGVQRYVGSTGGRLIKGGKRGVKA